MPLRNHPETNTAQLPNAQKRIPPPIRIQPPIAEIEAQYFMEHQESSEFSLPTVTPRVYRPGSHPRARRRRSRHYYANSYTHQSQPSVSPGEDSGYEASPSSVTGSLTFNFDENYYYTMPNSLDYNRRHPNSAPATPVRIPNRNRHISHSDDDLDSPSDHAISPSIPIASGSHSVSISTMSRSFSPGSPYRQGFLNPVAMMAHTGNGLSIRQRGNSAPPACSVDQRTVGTQTSPLITAGVPAVRHRRASSAVPLPDLLPPSARLTRPRSLSTCSFPGLDPQGHPLTPQDEEEPFSNVGSRLRSISDAFEESRRRETWLGPRRQPIEVEVAALIFDFYRFFLGNGETRPRNPNNDRRTECIIL